MHRYIPVLAKNAGFGKIGKKSATPSPEIWKTKFGMERFINGFLDLITIWFLSDLEKTNAFIWCNGIANVHHWFFIRLYWRFKTIPYVYEHAL
jgi:hypothetical protein